mmetsp:Transcript_74869/g.206507  ORF Transcript_74869/g.206507 Transcript_74869/m.206507 type:complete len:87 (-) Transcript_74869:581-841(-)|eukprot:4493350-Prymnesium_polylepis.2
MLRRPNAMKARLAAARAMQLWLGANGLVTPDVDFMFQIGRSDSAEIWRSDCIWNGKFEQSNAISVIDLSSRCSKLNLGRAALDRCK